MHRHGRNPASYRLPLYELPTATVPRTDARVRRNILFLIIMSFNKWGKKTQKTSFYSKFLSSSLDRFRNVLLKYTQPESMIGERVDNFSKANICYCLPLSTVAARYQDFCQYVVGKSNRNDKLRTLFHQVFCYWQWSLESNTWVMLGVIL